MHRSDSKVRAVLKCPLVSIVINNYNYARYLRKAIDSALQQTYTNIEIIIVDDGSTDESRQILCDYQTQCSVIYKSNGGQASAFNIGINAAAGHFILLLDSDDYLLPSAVELCVAYYPTGYSRVYYRLRLVDENDEEMTSVSSDQFFTAADGDMFAEIRRSGRHFWPPTSANFFDSAILKSVLPIPEAEFRISADAYIAAWTGLRGPVKSLDMPLAAYRLHGSNSFYTARFRYSDTKQLKARLESHFRIQNLLHLTCEQSGFSYPKPPDLKDYSVVKCLCVGYRYGILGPLIGDYTSIRLMKCAGIYLISGDGSNAGRLLRSIYLVVLLFAPMAAAKRLVRWADR
jgi:glycosyltransferase involved in cell wall biosynthesis